MPAPDRSERREHAIVIGASIGGLTAAAALAPHYRRVTVLDRDALPGELAHRRGVPQSKHPHCVQPGGVRAFNQLLPGIEEQLIAGGARRGDLSADCTWTISGHRFAAEFASVSALGLTRPFLEHLVRTRIAALSNVTIRDRAQARALVADQSGRVTGVEIEADGAAAEVLDSDLVVDATGTATNLPAWLAELGYPAPREERAECRMAWLTQRWRLDPARQHTGVVHVIAPAATPQFGIMIAQEDGTHIVSVGGLLDSAPEKTEAAYLEFANNLPDPVIADALRGAAAVSALQQVQFPASVRRRYDKVGRFPSGVIPIADAIASVNPLYGQGMSVAALEAVRLRAMLDRGPLNARAFFAAAHRIEDAAWKVATRGDLRFAQIEGKRRPGTKVMNRYLDRFARAAAHDPELTATFLRVAGLVDRPATLYGPATLMRVLRGGRTAPASVPDAVPKPATR